MTQEIHQTFIGITQEDFVAHADAMVANAPSDATKRQAIAYLSKVLSADQSTLESQRKEMKGKRYAQRLREEKINQIHDALELDFSKSPGLFSAQTLSDQDMIAAFAVDQSHVYLGGKQYTGDITIAGDRVTLDGQGSGSAVAETLANTAQITGTLHITGEDCVIKNVNFVSTGEKAVTVGGGAKNLVLDSCTFTCGQNINDAKWFYGAGLGAGTLTIKNCRIEGFNSWYLGDASTTSSAATVKLSSVEIIDNYFKNNHGSFAIRGPVSDPNGKVTIARNKFETDTFHQYFWDFVEVSGAVREVLCIDNEFIGVPGTHTAAGKKGGVQVWSKSAVPWTLRFSQNTAANLKVLLKIAHNSTFYSPNTFDPNHRIEFDKPLTDVAYCFSPVYKKEDGTTASDDKWQEGDYVPENATLYPSPPPVINPQGYAVVQQSN